MEIRWLGEVELTFNPSQTLYVVETLYAIWILARVHSQGGNWGSVSGAVSSKVPEQGYNGPGNSSSRVGNSKIPYTLTLSLPFPVVRNQDLDHTIKPRQSL